jgi:hypothetical protein
MKFDKLKIGEESSECNGRYICPSKYASANRSRAFLSRATDARWGRRVLTTESEGKVARDTAQAQCRGIVAFNLEMKAIFCIMKDMFPFLRLIAAGVLNCCAAACPSSGGAAAATAAAVLMGNYSALAGHIPDTNS